MCELLKCWFHAEYLYLFPGEIYDALSGWFGTTSTPSYIETHCWPSGRDVMSRHQMISCSNLSRKHVRGEGGNRAWLLSVRQTSHPTGIITGQVKATLHRWASPNALETQFVATRILFIGKSTAVSAVLVAFLINQDIGFDRPWKCIDCISLARKSRAYLHDDYRIVSMHNISLTFPNGNRDDPSWAVTTKQ